MPTKYIVGWNMPGYLPDFEPMECDTLESARQAIKDELMFHYEQQFYVSDKGLGLRVWYENPLHTITRKLLIQYGEITYAAFGDYVYWIAVEPK
jgi:hypothetical protein